MSSCRPETDSLHFDSFQLYTNKVRHQQHGILLSCSSWCHRCSSPACDDVSDNIHRLLTRDSLAASLAGLFGAIIGTWHMERLGRRKILILSTFACSLVLACAMTCSAASHVSTSGFATGISVNEAASQGAIAFLILFGAAYAWGYQPLLGLYPSEVLSMEQRATGLGCMVLVSNSASKSEVSGK